MTNHAAGRQILEHARGYALANMQHARAAGLLNGVIRSAQEVVELSLKAAIRELGGDYPKVPDPAAAFVALALASGVELAPPEARRLLDVSRRLAEARGPAFYFEQAFSAEEAARAAEDAEGVLAFVEKRVFAAAPGAAT